ALLHNYTLIEPKTLSPISNCFEVQLKQFDRRRSPHPSGNNFGYG
ncbi:hypothetical protein K1719_032508, partial [Acacia pycnantha]